MEYFRFVKKREGKKVKNKEQKSFIVEIFVVADETFVLNYKNT